VGKAKRAHRVTMLLVGTALARLCPPYALQPLVVIASEAKQSSATRNSGLLRHYAPRNDGSLRRTFPFPRRDFAPE